MFKDDRERARLLDEQLVWRSKAGDREAFEQIVSRHQAAVYRVVRGILGDAAESEDVVQEVFLKAYAKLGSFRGESRLFTWLYRIAVNKAFRIRRRRAPQRIEDLPETEAPPPEPEGEEEVPSLRTLQLLLGRLPDDFRVIVILRDLEGLSYQEIAETLEVPIGTVESRLFRARQELRTFWRKTQEGRKALSRHLLKPRVKNNRCGHSRLGIWR